MNKLNNVPARKDRLFGRRLNGSFSISGIVHVIRDESELPYFREGEILVAQCLDANWLDQLALAKAIIEDAGVLDSNAETISNQYDKPAVVAVEDAMSLRSGDIVTIHPSGEIELRADLRAPDSPMRVSVPDAVDARSNTIITAANVVSISDHLARAKSSKPDSENEEDTLSQNQGDDKPSVSDNAQ